MKKLIMLLIVVVLIGCSPTSEHTTNTNEDFASYDLSGKVIEGKRVVEVKSQRYFFEPAVIVVNTEENIKIQLESVDTAHSFSVSEIGFDLTGKQGEVVEGEFIAPVPGVYVINCSVYCGTGHSKMLGTLVVK